MAPSQETATFGSKPTRFVDVIRASIKIKNQYKRKCRKSGTINDQYKLEFIMNKK